jgi:hypothetical protein
LALPFGAFGWEAVPAKFCGKKTIFFGPPKNWGSEELPCPVSRIPTKHLRIYWALGQSGCSKRIFFSKAWGKKEGRKQFFLAAAKKTKKLGGKKLLCPNQIAALPSTVLTKTFLFGNSLLLSHAFNCSCCRSQKTLGFAGEGQRAGETQFWSANQIFSWCC